MNGGGYRGSFIIRGDADRQELEILGAKNKRDPVAAVLGLRLRRAI